MENSSKEERRAAKKEHRAAREAAKEARRAARHKKELEAITDSSILKRKRSSLPEELEIDVSAPEPPSKKAARLSKKAERLARQIANPRTKKQLRKSIKAQQQGYEPFPIRESYTTRSTTRAVKNAEIKQRRSDYGVWIGNLSYKITIMALREFVQEKAGVKWKDMTRVYLPTQGGAKGPNKGFAYLDLESQEAVDKVLKISETLMDGRRILVKESKNFAGRPERAPEKVVAGVKEGKPPGRKVFVGNLSFDVTREDIEDHFGQCGEVDDVFLATFEDSGKCKGFSTVTFARIEDATKAVRGWVDKPLEDSERESEVEDKEEWDGVKDEDEDEEAAKRAPNSSSDAASSDSDDDEGGVKLPARTLKKQKTRKWWVNKLYGRALRVEFAEDPSLRYKKRFHGKDGNVNQANAENGDGEDAIQEVQSEQTAFPKRENGTGLADSDRSRKSRHGKIDARKIRPGAAHANAQRSTGAIVAPKGQKTTFD